MYRRFAEREYRPMGWVPACRGPCPNCGRKEINSVYFEVLGKRQWFCITCFHVLHEVSIPERKVRDG